MKHFRRAAAALLLSMSAQAAESTDTALTPLETITVLATGVSNLTAASAGDISRTQLDSQPLSRPAAMLENVPGLIVTQHSGEGKANQYFLRAFNLDHGTDLALEVDDMPVNMPTHAHGQGYSDLNFVIPEVVGDLHYKKGPYYADEGDFATAGTVRMGLLNELPARASFGFGEDGYRRALLTGSTDLLGGELSAAGEIYHNDGPFIVPDDYNRLNGMARFLRGDDRDYFTLTAMGYAGRWNSTDQVPERAIAEGLIDRFGSLNPSDGGISSRYSLSLNRVIRTEAGEWQASAYVIRYKLDLWSTFTGFLADPVNGDQMLQHDDRVVYGAKASKSWFTALLGASTTNVIGLQTRVDDIRDVGIFSTVARRTIGTVQDAGVREGNAALYAESSTRWSDFLNTTIGVRADGFDFDVRDKMPIDPLGCACGNKRAAIVSPKAGIVLGPWADTTYFIDLGDGYHSNDARGITRSGQGMSNNPVTPLTRATGGEIGIASKAIPNLETRVDVFRLSLKSELVFDGDAGVTTPSGATMRTGVEWTNTYRFNDWLSAEFNTAFTRARFDHDAPADDLGCSDAAPSNPCARPIGIVGRYVPNSPTNVSDAALAARRESGWFGEIRARHFGESPLVEDNSAKSPAYTTVDAQVGFKGANWLASLDVFNIANAKWNDIEYYYVSRLKNEPSPLADYVIHPGMPRTLRARVQYSF